MAAVQYTFTHKQYTEQRNETECTDRNIIRVHKYNNKKKGKAVPLQDWTGPEGSRKLRLPDFVTTARMVVGCQPYAPAALTPKEILLVLISVRG